MTPLSGRIVPVPLGLWHDEVLGPQFAADVADLLPWHVAVEKVLLLEYARLGVLTGAEVAAVAARLHAITPDSVVADRHDNMSDLAFAIERLVTRGLAAPVPAWHVDRSRNDLQATAQVLAARSRLLDVADALARFAAAAERLAARGVGVPMPAYTHLQAAQVATPGFYFAALLGETVRMLARLGHTYAELDLCPLGAGALTGQELPWDRTRMATLLGFAGPQPHALTAVASRGWALSVAADLAGFGVTLSRFATDLMTWASGAYGFFDLPDELSGISSAMPQKKNFPVLERIRGRTGHLATYWLDIAAGQRNTPYTNMIEVSKEAGAHLGALFDTAGSVLRLFTAVLECVSWDEDRMRAACGQEFLGGFTLANQLTLRAGVPWRAAQVIAGRYVAAAMDRGRRPHDIDPGLLGDLAAAQGHPLADPDALLASTFTVDGALLVKRSAGSAHPDAVRELLAASRRDLATLAGQWAARRSTVDSALATIDRELGLTLADRALLLFVESNTTGTGMLALRTAARLGLAPVFLTSKPDRYAGLTDTPARVVDCETNDPATLRDAVARLGGRLAGVATTSEFYLTSVAELADSLGLPGNAPGAVAACRDKSRTRAVLAEAGVRQPRFAVVTRRADVPAAARVIGLPCVAKPAEDSGSTNVLLCSTVDELAAHVDRVLAVDTNVRGQPAVRTVLVEEYLPHPEYSVELFSVAGAATCVGITEKAVTGLPYFIECGHVFPAELPPDVANEMADTAVRALTATGFAYGASHLEVKLTPAGAAVVEINARLAGGMIPELIRLATGTDLLEQQVRAFAGLPVTPSVDHHRYAGIRFLLAGTTGVLDRFTGVDEARRLPGVDRVVLTATPGDAVFRPRDAYDRLGYVIAVGDTAVAVRDTLDRAVDRTGIVMREGTAIANRGEVPARPRTPTAGSARSPRCARPPGPPDPPAPAP